MSNHIKGFDELSRITDVDSHTLQMAFHLRLLPLGLSSKAGNQYYFDKEQVSNWITNGKKLVDGSGVYEFEGKGYDIIPKNINVKHALEVAFIAFKNLDLKNYSGTFDQLIVNLDRREMEYFTRIARESLQEMALLSNLIFMCDEYLSDPDKHSGAMSLRRHDLNGYLSKIFLPAWHNSEGYTSFNSIAQVEKHWEMVEVELGNETETEKKDG